MAREIERKFLVKGTSWKRGAEGVRFRQGYLCSAKERTVRVRTEGTRAVLTIKSLTRGVERQEYEYPIPLAEANQMLDTLCEQPLIDKVRYMRTVGPHLWEVDEFFGDNEGLVIAEVELGSAHEAFAHPPWLGREVSGDPRYFNSNLIHHPYRTWA